VSTKSCTAVGYSGGGTLVESWDGAGWSVAKSPKLGQNSSLDGVSCTSPRWCVAVGGSSSSSGVEQPLVESWDGAVWSVAKSPTLGASRGALNGVSCISASFCAAVGNDGSNSLVEHWDGAAWWVVASPTPGTYAGLSGVSCVSAKSCMAVGNFSTGTGSGASTLPRALAESWDGRAWSAVTPPGPSVAYLYGVSCLTTFCRAVGDYSRGIGPVGALVESWNGQAWSFGASSSPAVAYLYAVACASATSCKAVGEYTNGTSGASPTDPLIESWNGVAWSP
jgi:hypothetical protein